MADLADRHDLYEQSVQDVASEVDFMRDTYKALRGKDARVFREDFCGTASACCEWVQRDSSNTAVGVDFDRPTLDWGISNRLSRLSDEQRARIRLLEADVLQVDESGFDVVGAFNFSYWTFRTRPELIDYFSRVRASLADGGLFMLDAFGGSEAFEEMKEKTKHDGFTYVWDQAKYHPVTGYMKTHIHFKFPDGSKMKKAFTYEWRLWTLPEIQELLLESGFAKATIYWEGDDEDGDGNGIFEPETRGEADLGWIAYIVAEQ
ncbi:MAG: class I SAM-dependent methyltransferase [Pseudomonadota bacterium]